MLNGVIKGCFQLNPTLSADEELRTIDGGATPDVAPIRSGTWPEFNEMIGGFFKFHWVYFSGPVLPHMLAGIQYALGDLSADDSPSAGAR